MLSCSARQAGYIFEWEGGKEEEKAIKEGRKRGVGRHRRPHPISERVDFFPSPIPSFLPHSERCFNPIPFICGVGGGGGGCPFCSSPPSYPPSLRPFIPQSEGRTDSRIERISNRPLYPNRKNMWKEEDERGEVWEGKSDGHRYPVICRSTRPRHPPTHSLARSHTVEEQRNILSDGMRDDRAGRCGRAGKDLQATSTTVRWLGFQRSSSLSFFLGIA